jgi:hypothetical protein
VSTRPRVAPLRCSLLPTRGTSAASPTPRPSIRSAIRACIRSTPNGWPPTGARCWAGPMRTPGSSRRSLTWCGSIPATGRIPSSTQRPRDASRSPWTTLASPRQTAALDPGRLVKPGRQPHLRATRIGARRPHPAALVVGRPGRVAHRPGSSPWNGADHRWHLWHRSRVRAAALGEGACLLHDPDGQQVRRAPASMGKAGAATPTMR